MQFLLNLNFIASYGNLPFKSLFKNAPFPTTVLPLVVWFIGLIRPAGPSFAGEVGSGIWWEQG